MRQLTFLLRFLPGRQSEGEKILSEGRAELAELVKKEACHGFSLWQAADLVFGYYEKEDEAYPDAAGTAVRDWVEKNLADTAWLIASPGNMRLMYDVVINPRREKTGLGYRVFMTRLKPGTAEEYKARHDKLSAPGKEDRALHPEKYGCVTENFTCWNGGDYICGYRELEPGTPREPVNEEWERYMFRIMDWITDDADTVSGEKHEAVRCLYRET